MSELFYGNIKDKNWKKIANDVDYQLYPTKYYLRKIEAYKKEKGMIKFNIRAKTISEVESIKKELSLNKDLPLDYRTKILDIKPILWFEFVEKLDENKKSIYEDLENINSYYDSNPNIFEKNRKPILKKELNGDYNFIIFDRRPRGNKLYVQANTVQLRRMVEAIDVLRTRPFNHHLPLLKLFEENESYIDWPIFKNKKIKKYNFLDDRRTGAGIQQEFTEIALSTTDFALLNGPPGTGKTQVICEIIYQEVKKGKKILLVGSTHVAVDNVLERLMGHEEAKKIVLPIRIGSENNISEIGLKYKYEKINETEKNRITEGLVNLGKKRSRPQEKLYQALMKSDDKSFIDEHILNSANLVCGTTIGFLQFPGIRGDNQTVGRPYFDLMILDEASKTTLHEFLVPALWSKKWILSGDPKQLSPFVDNKDIKLCLNRLTEDLSFDEDKKYASLILLEILLKRKEYTLIVCDDNSIDIYREFNEHMINDTFVNKTKPNMLILNDELFKDNENIIEFLIMRSDIIVINLKELKKYSKILPSKLSLYFHIKKDGRFTLDNFKFLPVNLLGRSIGMFEIKNIVEFDSTITWEEQLEYRLSRKFQLRNDPKNMNKFDDEVKILTLDFKLRVETKKISDIFFPSILEMLEGEHGRKKKNRGSTFLEGFFENDKKSRFRLLKYQHRMHSKISSFPRENIYMGKSLLDGDNIDSLRNPWFENDSDRLKWIDVKNINNLKHGKELNFNMYEVDAIERKLEEFDKWTRKNNNQNDKIWTVAILSFYVAQKEKLKKMLQNYFNSSNTRTFRNKRIKVEVSTVDRFQGHEADLVFLSFVRNKAIGFLDSPNRINVGITRARYQLILVGNKNFFASNNRSKLLKELGSRITSVERGAEIFKRLDNYNGGKKHGN